MLTRRASAVGCALLALTCGCSSAHPFVAPSATTTPTAVIIRPTRGSTTSSPPATTTTTTTTAPTGTVVTTTSPPTSTTAAPVTQPTGPSTGLAALILDTVPSGYPRQPDDIGQTGPTNLAQAVEIDVSPNARRALLVTGFVTGYQRQWASPDGYTIDQDFLFEFQTPKGAQGYAQHWRDTLVKTNSGSPLQSFTPAFIPGSFGLETKDKTGSTAVVMFAKGVYAVEATVNGGVLAPGDPAVDQSGPATALGLAQYQRLP